LIRHQLLDYVLTLREICFFSSFVLPLLLLIKHQTQEVKMNLRVGRQMVKNENEKKFGFSIVFCLRVLESSDSMHDTRYDYCFTGNLIEVQRGSFKLIFLSSLNDESFPMEKRVPCLFIFFDSFSGCMPTSITTTEKNFCLRVLSLKVLER
jgi:hypothetical protein